MSGRDGLAADLRDIRRAFDAHFARPAPPHAEASVRLLGIRVAGVTYALRVEELAGLTQRKLVPCPSRLPDMAGLTAVRGALCPVYHLASLLGHPRNGTPSWLALVRTRNAFAVGFDALDGYLELGREQLVPLPERRSYMQVMATSPGGARPVIDLAALVAMVERRLSGGRASEPTQER